MTLRESPQYTLHRRNLLIIFPMLYGQFALIWERRTEEILPCKWRDSQAPLAKTGMWFKGSDRSIGKAYPTLTVSHQAYPTLTVSHQPYPTLTVTMLIPPSLSGTRPILLSLSVTRPILPSLSVIRPIFPSSLRTIPPLLSPSIFHRLVSHVLQTTRHAASAGSPSR